MHVQILLLQVLRNAISGYKRSTYIRDFATPIVAGNSWAGNKTLISRPCIRYYNHLFHNIFSCLPLYQSTLNGCGVPDGNLNERPVS
jgi:hypothetical protein